MSKVKDFERLVISEDDVLLKRVCIKRGTTLELPDDASEEAKKEKDGVWGDPEIIKASKNYAQFTKGLIVTSFKGEYPIIWFSDEEEGVAAKVGTIRYFTYPARLIDTATEKTNYES